MTSTNESYGMDDAHSLINARINAVNKQDKRRYCVHLLIILIDSLLVRLSCLLISNNKEVWPWVPILNKYYVYVVLHRRIRHRGKFLIICSGAYFITIRAFRLSNWASYWLNSNDNTRLRENDLHKLREFLNRSYSSTKLG